MTKIESGQRDRMTPAQLKAARKALGLSANAFARWVNVSDGSMVRRWERDTSEPNARDIPGPVEVLVRAALESAAVRQYFGLTLRPGAEP